MFKYFTSHTEVNWSKKNRMTHDNQGIGDVSSHNSHFGMRKANKHHVTMFPFGFEPMQGAQHIQTTTCLLAAVIAVSPLIPFTSTMAVSAVESANKRSTPPPHTHPHPTSTPPHPTPLWVRVPEFHT